VTDALATALSLTYAWIKAGHVIFVIFWIAGLFMLPRFYVYHQESAPGSAEEKRWIERERKLRRIIITPAMILVWIFGLSLAWTIQAWTMGWFQAKFILVSYSNEGMLSVEELTEIFERYGTVRVYDQNYAAFRASRNLHKRSKEVVERLFVIEK
jgi:uncharacterized membrane protein